MRQAESQSEEALRAIPENGSRLKEMCVFGEQCGQPQEHSLCCSKAQGRIIEALPIPGVGKSRDNGGDGEISMVDPRASKGLA